jgi:hypothetical protein
MSQLLGLAIIKQATLTQSTHCALPVRFPDFLAHLQCLNQKFCFDDSAGSGLQIEKIGSAASLAPNSLEHGVDFDQKLGVLTATVPGRFGDFHELIF